MPRLLNTTSLTEQRRHLYDDYKHLGYDYHRNILKNTMSDEMFSNPMNDIPFRQIERMIEYLIDTAKQIKLHFNFTLDKNDYRIQK